MDTTQTPKMYVCWPRNSHISHYTLCSHPGNHKESLVEKTSLTGFPPRNRQLWFWKAWASWRFHCLEINPSCQVNLIEFKQPNITNISQRALQCVHHTLCLPSVVFIFNSKNPKQNKQQQHLGKGKWKRHKPKELDRLFCLPCCSSALSCLIV